MYVSINKVQGVMVVYKDSLQQHQPLFWVDQQQRNMGLLYNDDEWWVLLYDILLFYVSFGYVWEGW